MVLNRPYYSETRNSVKELPSDELRGNVLVNKIVSDKDAEPLKAEINKHI